MTKGIDYFGYNNPLLRLRTRFAIKARKRIFDIFMDLYKPGKDDSIIDIGATPDNSLTYSNLFEKYYPYKENFTVSSIEDCSGLVKDLGLREFVKTEPHQKFPFVDKQFKYLFSNAVIEHVGTREQQKQFLKECLRVSENVLLTTPNRYFPVEMHTILPLVHWLPLRYFQWIIRNFWWGGEFWSKTENLNLLWESEIIRLLDEINPDHKTSVMAIRTLGFKSNLIIYTKPGS